MTKACRVCGQEKPVDGFYQRMSQCKECFKAKVTARRNSDIERFRAYDRQRYADRADRKKNSADCARRALADGRHAEYNRRHREKYPDRYAARTKLNNALRDGKIVKSPCAVCGEAKAQAHHEDYSRPLDVVWLCATHHGETWRGPRA